MARILQIQLVISPELPGCCVALATMVTIRKWDGHIIRQASLSALDRCKFFTGFKRWDLVTSCETVK